MRAIYEISQVVLMCWFSDFIYYRYNILIIFLPYFTWIGCIDCKALYDLYNDTPYEQRFWYHGWQLWGNYLIFLSTVYPLSYGMFKQPGTPFYLHASTAFFAFAFVAFVGTQGLKQRYGNTLK